MTFDSADVLALLEESSDRNTLLDRAGATAHFIVMLVFILTVTSFGKNGSLSLGGFLLYPAVMIGLGRTPLSLLLRIYLTVLPLFFFFFLSSLIFDGGSYEVYPGVIIREGWITGGTLLLKGTLAILAALSFIGLKGFGGVLSALGRFRVPPLFISILSVTFWYIRLLLNEGRVIYRAYILRAPGHRGIYWKDWGPLGGQWFIRTLRKAEGLQNAIDLRGGEIEYLSPGGREKAGPADILWCLFWIAYCFILRRASL